MYKQFVLITSFLFSLLLGRAEATVYQDFWWNPSMSGMGWNVSQQNNTVVMAWFNYGEDGKASFLTLSGELDSNKVKGMLYRSTGMPPQSSYSPAIVNTQPVGTAELEFNASNSAVFTYKYDGRSGRIVLERFTFSVPNMTGRYSGAFSETFTCGSSLREEGPLNIRIFHNPGSGSLNLIAEGCELKGAYIPTGGTGRIVGKMSCDGKSNEDFEAYEINKTNFSLSMRFRTAYGACTSIGTISGIKLD